VFGKQSEKTQAKNPEDKKEAKGKTGGSGRHGKDNYPNANHAFHSHKDLKEKQTCPECQKGKLYSFDPGVHIRVSGHAPLEITVHQTEKLRCGLCGQIFEADFDGKSEEKFDAQSKAVIA